MNIQKDVSMVKLKICGLKTIDDIKVVNKYIPDYIGFVFANTKRFVSDEQALEMKKALDPRIKAVGVFVNEPVNHVIALAKQGIIDVAQLHGQESDAYIKVLKYETGIPVIKAIKVQTSEQVIRNLSLVADMHLFDTYKKDVLGGTGERFDLDILNHALEQVPIENYFLAGGLTPENAADILNKQIEFDADKKENGFIGLDISTGVESDGVKDESKIKEFICNIRGNY